MTEPLPQNQQSRENSDLVASPQLLWLNICPYRVAMTKQGNGRVNYRHFWEQEVYGFSRYWLRNQSLEGSEQICLRNFTCLLTLTGCPLPEHLRLEYELWSEKLQLVGCYILDLEIHH